MGSLTVLFEIGGLPCTPKEWQDIEIQAIFGEEIQPTLSIDEFTFVNEDAQRIFDWVEKHPFEGMPFNMGITDGVNGLLSIDGCLDFYEKYEIISPVEVKVKIKLENGLDLFDERLASISYGYLAQDGGIIGKNDYVNVPVIVKKKFDATEVAFTALSLFLITKEMLEFLKDNGVQKISDLKKLLTPPANLPAESFQSIAIRIIRIIYVALMLVALIEMLKTLQKNLIPVKTNYKGITLRKALQKACDHFEVDFISNIPELDWYVYLPSKIDGKYFDTENNRGIPNVSDYGYQLDEMFELCQRLFLAKRVKFNNAQGKPVLYLYALKDPFWQTITNYTLTKVLSERYALNMNEMKANYIISFQYDPTDDYTMPNENQSRDYFKGVNFQMITDVGNTVFNEKYKLNRGLQEVSIPLALGTRRDHLSVLETSLKVVLSAADLVIKLFGGKTFATKINEHRGALIISSPSFNVAKLLVIKDDLIPANHRSLLSASRLYNEYHFWQSFVGNPDIAQKRIYDDYSFPFDFSAFTKTIKSGGFTAADKPGKFRQISWRINGDKATATYEISGRYAFGLNETGIEA